MSDLPATPLFSSLQAMQKDYQDTLPPVDKWNPELNGDLDMRIDREGRWFYQGGEITRAGMVKMFASILKREGDEYFLLTPVEKWRITVDVAPFLFVSLRLEQDHQTQGIVLKTNVGNEVLISADNPFWMESGWESSPLPMVMVRNQLPGLLSRPAFYQLVDLCYSVTDEQGAESWQFDSAGCHFSVGLME